MMRIKQPLNPLLKYAVYLLVFTGFLFVSPVYGAEIDSITAKTVARNFYLSRLSQSKLKKSTLLNNEIEIALSHVENIDVSKQATWNNTNQLKPLYYVFNVNDNNGYIIVSGDDRVIPVLGYSFSGVFSINDQPPAFKDWTSNYKEQITYQIKNNVDADPYILQEWSSLMRVPVIKNVMQINEVLPLLSTTWDQGCYYNELSPADSEGPCDHALVGCVAVAIGQIMKYWSHPASSNQIYGYYEGPDYGCLPDIGTSTYDWSNMPDDLTIFSETNEIQAVAELLYNAGVACLMNFGPDRSGTSSSNARDALISNFNYSSSTQLIDKIFFDDESWAQLIIDELENQRPVYYSGSGTGGHAWVCDGYQDSAYFHFNWGGSGSYDGYFYVSDLTPGEYSFNNFQDAIIGIVPEVESQPDPLDHILDIEGVGSEYSQTFTSGGAGAWDHFNCYISTPGGEQVYSFVAPVLGYYSIEVVAASSNIVYSWRKADCGEPGWECIEDISSSGTYGDLPWTAGTTYHILLDDVDQVSNSHQFYVNIPVPATHEIEYFRHTIDDDNVNTSSGDDDGLTEAWESIELSIVLNNSGDFDVHNVSAALSTLDPHISITSAINSFGDISAGNGVQSTEDYGFDVSPDCPEKDVTFTLEITSDEGSWTDQFTITVYIDIPPVPEIEYFSHQIDDNTSSGDDDGLAEPGESINLPLSLRNIGDGDAYNVSAELSISDPYISITTATNSFGNISVNSTRQSAGDYGFDVLPDCPEKDITFTLEITSDEGSWTNQFTIHVNIDIPPAPEIEYFSHQIDDNTTSGDGDGLVEQGETIKMPITLKNIGDESAHNVVAVLSASDVAISVVSESHSFYDITAGGSAQGSGNYTFEVAEDCREKDIAFTLEITSDEGSWTDQFLLHVNHQVTSISKYSFNSELNLYPNPAKDAIFLKSDLEFNSQIEIRIMDSMGRTVYLQIYPSLMKGDIIEIDLSDYHNGMYFFQFNHLDLRKTKKIIKE